MKTALLIPVYEQKKYWLRMLSAIEKLSVRPDCVYVLMDRPKRSDFNYIQDKCSSLDLKNTYKVYNLKDVPEFVGRPNNLPEQELFLTGYRRNQGLEFAIADGCDSFVFIDGDCIPQVDLIKAHNDANYRGVPNLSVGRRREEKHNWKDQREVDPNVKSFGLFSRTPRHVINSQYLLTSSSIVWTCNSSLNIQAVNRIKRFNSIYYNRSEVFCSEFLGTWGGEDGFLGIQASLCNIAITMLNEKKGGIVHIDHPRPVNKYAPEAFGIYLKEHIQLLDLMIKNKPLDLDFFTD
jgi:hypothetical protein